jgi:hypothetical protein
LYGIPFIADLNICPAFQDIEEHINRGDVFPERFSRVEGNDYRNGIG